MPPAWFDSAVRGAVMGLELAAALIVVVAAVLGIVTAAQQRSWTLARRRFSAGLLFALDFTIGADVLKVALAPAWQDVLTVAGVVVVRIALTLALVWESRQEEDPERPGKGRPPASAK